MKEENTKMNFKPAVKWSGSKRSQSNVIIQRFPKTIDTYYEPFCGGCSMLMRLMLSDISVSKYIISDINSDLIALWNEIKNDPDEVSNNYEIMWHEMNDLDDDKNRKRDYFCMVRGRYNETHSPYDFMFIMRTTTNGMPRYNRSGKFNNSFHITRNGIKPQTLRQIINVWSKLLQENDITFISQSFEKITTNEGDFIYLDPPYANTKGMYFGSFDNNELWDWLRIQPAKYVLSYDGISGDDDNTYAVPNDLWTKHEYITSGNSSFKRTIGNDNDSIVYESLYIK